MSKIYLKNSYFNNHSISVHLVETNSHYIIEQNICGLKSLTKINKKRSDSLSRSNSEYSNRTSLIRRIVESTNFCSAIQKKEVR